MKTAAEAFREITKRLANSGKTQTPELDAEILLSFALNKTKEQIFCNPNVEVNGKYLEELTLRRINGEPVAYIIGKKEFWGMDFFVDKNVLIPRPDTETIIDAALNLLANKNEKLKILDLGTGSGCILISLLKELENAEGIGVDISANALKLAKKNAVFNGIKNAIFIESDWFSDIPKIKFDLVVSNPPYIAVNDIKISDEVKKYEPESALFAGNDGYACYEKIAANLGDYLNKDGIAIFEFGMGQEERIRQIFEDASFYRYNIYKDLTGINRVISIQL